MSNRDPANPITKVAFIKFLDPDNVGVAQHLTNTVFIDRALICTPYDEGMNNELLHTFPNYCYVINLIVKLSEYYILVAYQHIWIVITY